ncbi:coenzyme F420-reducing hydrogenase beta subunit [Arthrobacter sp. SLBN-100]|nr:coenzyme F420-reducing hydrogenase beta subunit [Arthrobacter sp. SLBN-100]
MSGSLPTITHVVNEGMCVGCGACSVATSGAIPVTIGRYGSFRASLEGVSESDLAKGSRVCPWAKESKNEDQIADEVFSEVANQDVILGKYTSVNAGRVGQAEDARKSSSGGLTSWTAIQLMERGEIDGVIHVGPGDSALFAYSVSYTVEELREKRKSFYYSTSFADALISIVGDGKTYAFIGVPCFVRAARSLSDEMPDLGAQLKFFLGLVCGHLKSDAFAELLAWQTGVAPDELKAVDFRVKNPNRRASQYDFGAVSRSSNEMLTRPTPSLIGGNWGHGMFQLNACNYCDDIFAETADVVFGDAWLPEFEGDWRGTNVIVNRNSIIEGILSEGKSSGQIEISPLAPSRAATSQDGNYRHRRIGLAVRLADDLAAGKWVPNKRVAAGLAGVDQRRLAIIRKRREISARSHVLFSEAKKRGSLPYFLSAIDPLLAEYRAIDSKPSVRRTIGRVSRMLRRAAAKFGLK